MDLKDIKSGLAKLSALVGGWSDDSVPSIERDMALDELRRIYEALRFEDGAVHAGPKAGEHVEDEAVIAVDLGEVLSLGGFVDMPVGEEPEIGEPETGGMPDPEIPEVEEGPEVEIELVVEEPFAEPEPEVVTESEPEIAVEPEPEIEPQAEEPFAEPESFVDPDPFGESEPKPQVAARTLFGFEDATEIHRRKQRVIMSLYDDEPQTKPSAPAADEPFFEEITVDVVPEPETAAVTDTVAGEATQAEVAAVPETEEPEMGIVEIDGPETPAGAVLGEVINSDVQTLADTIAPVEDVASQLRREPITDLRKSIGVNDKYLLIRDLFGGNGASYEIAVRALNNFESLDDCMIYIAEHYAWNPNSDGAKLMMELLERKYC